jgi:hypothetical protein
MGLGDLRGAHVKSLERNGCTLHSEPVASSAQASEGGVAFRRLPTATMHCAGPTGRHKTPAC